MVLPAFIVCIDLDRYSRVCSFVSLFVWLRQYRWAGCESVCNSNAFFVVFGSWMSLLIPAFSSIFNQASYVCIELILLGLRLLQDLPITMLEVSDVPIIPVCFWYAGCLYLLIWARRRNEVFMGLLVMGFALLLMGSFM